MAMPPQWPDVSGLRPWQGSHVIVKWNSIEFSAALSRFVKNLEQNVTKVVQREAEDLLQRTQRRTPVRTGRLRNSFHVVPPNSSDDPYMYTDDKGTEFFGGLNGGAESTGPHEAVVGTNVDYAQYVEGGTHLIEGRAMLAISLREKTVELQEKMGEAVQDAWDNA